MKKEIATLESALKKLSEQEAKYSAELDDALKQYAELKEQTADMDAAELMDAQQKLDKKKSRDTRER